MHLLENCKQYRQFPSCFFYIFVDIFQKNRRIKIKQEMSVPPRCLLFISLRLKRFFILEKKNIFYSTNSIAIHTDLVGFCEE